MPTLPKLGTLTFALLLLAAPPAAAGNAEDLLEEAVSRYAKADFEGSLQLLDGALAVATKPAQLAQIELYRGANMVVLGREADARRAFAAAIVHDPTVTATAERFNGKTVGLFDQIKSKLAVRAQPTAVAPLTPTPEATPERRGRLWTWIAAGGTVVAAGLATGFGLAALSAKDDYDQGPVAYLDSLEDKTVAWATRANAMWVTVGVLAAASVVLFFVEGRAGKSEHAGRRGGPTTAGLDGLQIRF